MGDVTPVTLESMPLEPAIAHEEVMWPRRVLANRAPRRRAAEPVGQGGRSRIGVKCQVAGGATRAEHVFHGVVDDAPPRKSVRSIVVDWARDADP